MPFKLLFAVLALFGLASAGISTASAHDIELRDWCGKNSKPVSLKEFNFDGDEMQQLFRDTLVALEKANDASSADGSKGDDNSGKCGIVDVRKLIASGLRADDLKALDEWTQASVSITLYCNQFEVRGYDVPMPFVRSDEGDPSSDYNRADHHKTYRLQDGLRGSCMACPIFQMIR